MIERRVPRRFVAVRKRMKIMAGAGGGVLLAGLIIAPQRAWPDLLMGSFAMVCLGLAGLFFVALQYASGAVWSIALRRVGEAMMAALPAGAAGVLLVLIARPSLYPWYAHPIHTEGWAGFKLAWLSYPFFLARAVIYFAVWMGFAWAIRKNSNRQDQEGGFDLSRRNTRLSAGFMVVFAFTFWLAVTDWVMSFEPQWTNTIFGIYHFSGMFTAGLAAIALLTVALHKFGPLRGNVTDRHLHDLGRLLLAFTTFWAYIWFSQFMLIWYTNLPEETSYMVLRTNSGWGKVFVINLLLNWAVPFLLLLPGVNKRTSSTLAAASVIVLAGRVTELYLMVIAPFARTPRPAIWDAAAIALVIGGFVLLALRSFFRAEPIPIGDPLLPESLHGHA